MVGWFASQLFQTGLDLLISTKLSSSHDMRIFNCMCSIVSLLISLLLSCSLILFVHILILFGSTTSKSKEGHQHRRT